MKNQKNVSQKTAKQTKIICRAELKRGTEAKGDVAAAAAVS